MAAVLLIATAIASNQQEAREQAATQQQSSAATPSPKTVEQTAPMPDVTGLDELAARATIEELGVGAQVIVREKPSEGPEGTVIQQEPTPGTPIDEFSFIYLYTAGPTRQPVEASEPTGGGNSNQGGDKGGNGVGGGGGGLASARTFDDGVWMVGKEVEPGTYRNASPGGNCYWARLKNFTGGLNSILANDLPSGPALVTILAGDTGFESDNCGEWTTDLSRITSSRTRFDDGMYIVGTDIAPGTYRNTGGRNCYWARLRDFTGGLNSILANDLPTGSALVQIQPSDEGFETDGCGTWRKV